MPVTIALAVAAGLAAAPASGERIEIDGAAVRLGDLAPLAGFAAAARAPGADRIVAMLPPGRSRIVVTRGALAGRVRRAAPAAGALSVENADAPVTIVRRLPVRTAADPAADDAAAAAAADARQEPAGIARGSSLTLVSRVGPVTITREVTAMQPGRPGGRMFVRDPEGAVFSVRIDAQTEGSSE
jgi:hypothetical protein